MSSSGKKGDEEDVPTSRRAPASRDGLSPPTEPSFEPFGPEEDDTGRMSLDELAQQAEATGKRAAVDIADTTPGVRMALGYFDGPPTGRKMAVSEAVEDPTTALHRPASTQILGPSATQKAPAASDTDFGVRAGDVLAGKYRVERVLGTGGMGVVVGAHHLHLEERVALKLLLPAAVKDTTAVARFIREAKSAVKIKGEHVARVTDVGQLENGTPFIVMEYLDGVDLAAWLKLRGPLPITLAVDFVLQACEAVADAHALGIVHRDLKPANMFCVKRSDGELSIKVLDFGISKVTTPGAPGHDMTGTTALVGTPYYMSPEQMHSARTVDPRTDIWALGVILFELLTGRPPFDGETLPELAIRVASEAAPPARSLRADVPAGLDQVIATCLVKDRAGRYPSVSELAIALRDFGSKKAKASVERVLGTLRHAGISGAMLPPSGEYSAATMPPTPSVPPTAPQTAGSWGNTGAANRQTGNPLLWLAVAVGVAGLALAGVLVSRSSTPPSTAATLTATVSRAVASPAPSTATAAPSTTAPDASEPPTPAASAVPLAPSSAPVP